MAKHSDFQLLRWFAYFCLRAVSWSKKRPRSRRRRGGGEHRPERLSSPSARPPAAERGAPELPAGRSRPRRLRQTCCHLWGDGHRRGRLAPEARRAYPPRPPEALRRWGQRARSSGGVNSFGFILQSKVLLQCEGLACWCTSACVRVCGRADRRRSDCIPLVPEPRCIQGVQHRPQSQHPNTSVVALGDSMRAHARAHAVGLCLLGSQTCALAAAQRQISTPSAPSAWLPVGQK